MEPVDESMLASRKNIAEKFITGEFGVELDGFEEGRAADRLKSKIRDDRWRVDHEPDVSSETNGSS